MKFKVAVILSLFSATVAYAGGRSLPNGEDNPGIVSAVFQTTVGEVQILQKGDGASAILRTEDGALSRLVGMDGASRCNEWLKATAKGQGMSAPSCTLLFRSDANGAVVRVDARNLVRGSLFSIVRNTIKGQYGSL